MQTGSVYQIWSVSTTDRYIGSTIQALSMRMSGHRADFKRWKVDNKKFCSSYGVLRFEDAKIELIELVEFQFLSQLKAREGHHIRAGNCLNKLVAGRTEAEWKVDNREEILKKKNAYNAEHRAEAAAKVQCNCGSIHTHANTAHHKKTQKHQAYLTTLV